MRVKIHERTLCLTMCSVASVTSDSLWPYGLQAHQAPLSLGFSREEYWSGLPFSPGDLPNPGIKSATPSLAGRFFTAESPGKLFYSLYSIKIYYKIMAMISCTMQFPCSLSGKLFLNASEEPRQNTLKKWSWSEVREKPWTLFRSHTGSCVLWTEVCYLEARAFALCF